MLVIEEEVDFAVEVLADVIRAQREITEKIDEAKDDPAAILIRALEGEVFWPTEHAFQTCKHVCGGERIAVCSFLFEPDKTRWEKPKTHDL